MNLKKAAEIALETLISLEELIPVGSKLAAIDILRKALAQQDLRLAAEYLRDQGLPVKLAVHVLARRRAH